MRFHRSLLRIALVCFFLSGYALTHAHGQEQPKPVNFDWKPVAAYSAAQGLDIWSTHRFLTNGSGCVEGNPWMFGTSKPSDAQLVAGLALSVSIMAGYSYGLYRLGRVMGHPQLLRRLVQGVGYGGAVYEVGITLKNLRACP